MSAGRAIAGHIGAQARFEYTVIGDPVNEAARLTELAKLEQGHVLASAIAVSGALDAEALCWDVGEIVELRGRTAPTQLARPLNLVSPSEVGDESTMSTKIASDVSQLSWRFFAPPSWPAPSSRGLLGRLLRPLRPGRGRGGRPAVRRRARR